MKISVVIPAFNSAATISKCLECVLASSYEDYEIIVVDDASTDQTAEVAKKYPFPGQVIRQEKKGGPAKARNKGAFAANGEIVLFVDADVLVKPDTLQLVHKAFVEHAEADAVQGIYSLETPHHNMATQYQNLYYHYCCIAIKTDFPAVFATWCAAIKKEIFIKINGFNANIPNPTVEDEEFGYELVESGHKIYMERDLLVTHLAKYNIFSFLKRRFSMAKSQIKSVFRKIPQRFINQYLNIGTNKTHHSRKVLLSIPISYLIALNLLALFVYYNYWQSYFILILLLTGLIFLNQGFLSFVKSKKGLLYSAKILIWEWLDMLALGFGIIIGGIEFIIFKKCY